MCIFDDLLDHLGELLLNGFELLCEGLPLCVGPRARSTCGTESIEQYRDFNGEADERKDGDRCFCALL